MNKLRRHLHHFFIPSHRNNYRAKTLHLDVLSLLLIFAMVLSFAHSFQKSNILGYATDITIEKLYQKTNEERVNNGLPALKYDNKLATAAQNKAQDMFVHDYWAHNRPSDGTPPWVYFTAVGYSYEYAGENLAKGYLFSDDVVAAWKDSPTHWANIIRPEYDEVGFAVLNGILQGEEVTLVVQMFGTPLAQDNSPPPLVKKVEAEEPAGQPESTSEMISPTIPVEMLVTQTDSQPPVVKGSILNFDKFSFNTSLAIISLLLLVLVFDLYFALKLKLIRVTSKNLAHLIFLSVIIIGLFLIKGGVIL